MTQGARLIFSDIAKRAELTAGALDELERLDVAAHEAMRDWLFDSLNPLAIEKNKNALDARARALADSGTALIAIARRYCAPEDQKR